MRKNPLQILPDDDDELVDIEFDSPHGLTKAEWRDFYREIVMSLGGVFRECEFEVAWADAEKAGRAAYELSVYGTRLN